jgi:hypothetical protein
MPDRIRGAGVFFYDREKRRVLFYRRDNTPTIPFPEGQAFLWLTEDEAARTPFAFGYNRLVSEFFGALRDGTV